MDPVDQSKAEWAEVYRTVTIEFTERELAMIKKTLAQYHNKVRKSRSKDWSPSTKALTMADAQRLYDKIIDADEQQR
jgi:hypothetical protein